MNRYQFPRGLWAKQVNITGPLYTDYLTSGTSLKTGAVAPDFAEFRNGLFLYAFGGTGALVEEAHFNVHILHDIKPGSNPTVHIHWAHNVASGSYTPDTNDVKWQLDYSYSHGYGAGTYPAPTTLTTTQTAGAQYEHHITDDDDMIITDSLEPDGVLLCRVYRDPADAADTFEFDASIIQVDIHYQIGQIGTPERNRPFGLFE